MRRFSLSSASSDADSPWCQVWLFSPEETMLHPSRSGSPASCPDQVTGGLDKLDSDDADGDTRMADAVNVSRGLLSKGKSVAPFYTDDRA